MALEALELAYRLLDARPELVQLFREEAQPLLGVRLPRDGRRNPLRQGCGAVNPRVISLVGHHDARRDVGAEIQGGFELSAIARLATVAWKSSRLPSRSVLRWILVEKPPRERPSA